MGAVYFFTNTYLNNQRTTNTFQQVGHTYEVIEEIDNLNNSILDLESQVRGYILTNNPVFLQGLSDGINKATDQLAHLQSLTRDNPVQKAYIETLSDLVDAKLDFQQNLLAAYKNSDRAALTMIASLKGKVITDNFKATLAKMHSEEQRLLQLRITANQSNNQRKFFWSLIVGALGFSLLMLALWKISEEYKRRRAAEHRA